ncbi:hypothetical protein R6Q59_007525 [Mikania micrantha]
MEMVGDGAGFGFSATKSSVLRWIRIGDFDGWFMVEVACGEGSVGFGFSTTTRSGWSWVKINDSGWSWVKISDSGGGQRWHVVKMVGDGASFGFRAMESNVWRWVMIGDSGG